MPVLVSADSQTNDAGGNLAFVDGGLYSHLAQDFVPTTSYPVAQIAVSLFKVGSPGGTIRLHIRADSGGNPGTSITNGDSATIDPSTLSLSTGFIIFTFPALPTIVAGTHYHTELTHAGDTFTVLKTVGWSNGGSNLYTAGTLEIQDNGGGWVNDGSSTDFAWKIYQADNGGGILGVLI